MQTANYDKLVDRIQRLHDLSAFEHLINEWQNMVYKRTYLATCGNATAATELAAQIFVDAWLDIVAGEYTKPFNSWFIQLVMRQCAAYLIRGKNEPQTN